MSIYTRVLFRYIYNTFQKQTDLRHNKLKKNPETEPEPGELRNLEPPSTSASALVVDPGAPSKWAQDNHIRFYDFCWAFWKMKGLWAGEKGTYPECHPLNPRLCTSFTYAQ